ncbi:hypothetical protein KC878_01785 [Candidatus Saccharibacteria bacterium]|nr:hypothetical protein [Candidatus Saccharibacteria bacterium]
MKDQRGVISTGVLALVAVLVVVGLLGWYMLDQSQKVNDEYDAADQANSSLLKKDDSKTDDTEPAAQDTQEQ